jgi:predicted acylesterase/phospholipase RssA/CRP-like cAMP-binding protein
MYSAFHAFESHGLFSDLSPKALLDISHQSTEVFVPAGHVVFRQGDPSDSLYIVAAGRLEISIEQNGHEPTSVFEAGTGEIVGEMGLLGGDPRSATVISLRDSLLFRLSKDTFEQLLNAHPALTRRIACNLSERLRQSNTRTYRRNYPVKTFAIMPAGEPAANTNFVEQFTRALSEIGPTRRITKETVERELKSTDMSDRRVAYWLNEQESRFAFLVYETDLYPSPWTSRCLRQADRLLSVAHFDQKRELNDIERRLANTGPRSSASNRHPRTDLVLLHRDSTSRPSGTPEWLAGRSVKQHHHLYGNSPKNFARLARVLTGKAAGLVLGGGGARGFAHIGAIKAIEEAGITIETVGGTSQGALIGAQYAMGLTPDEMIETNRALFRDYRPFKGDLTLPFFAFVTGSASNKGLQALFGGTKIADLRIPFFCISANLSLAKVIVERDEAVWKAVRCSMALPGLMPPVIKGGQLIIDGGVLNNLPVDVMRENCNGSVIAIDVSPPEDLLADGQDRDSLGFLDFVRRKLFDRKGGGSIPNLIEILMRTAFLSSIRHRETMAKHADLLVHPPMSGFSLLGWKNLETIVEIGYRTTRDKLKSWNDSSIPSRSGGTSDPGYEAEELSIAM